MNSSRRRYAAQRRTQQTGSQTEREPDFVLMGTVRRPHGVRGEVLFSLDTDFPEWLVQGAKFYLGDDHLPVKIRTRRQHSEGLLLTFTEFPDKGAVERLHNVPLFAKATEMPQLPEGKYYHHQLIGLQVVEESGETVGKLIHILNTGATDIYVVRVKDEKEILLPSISDVIRQIELDKKQIVVRIPSGLR